MWQFEASCNEGLTDIFFSDLKSKVARAKAICSSCPVSRQCLDFAIDTDIEFGTYGGMTPDERKALVNV